MVTFTTQDIHYTWMAGIICVICVGLAYYNYLRHTNSGIVFMIFWVCGALLSAAVAYITLLEYPVDTKE